MDYKLIIVLFMFINQTLSREIPEYLHICKKNDPNIDECFRQSVLYLKPYLAKGIPELKAPSIEPLQLKKRLILNPSGSQTVGLELSVHNIEAYGCSTYDIQNLKVDIPNVVISFNINFDYLYIQGQYNIDGRILLLPVTGNGKLTGNFTKPNGNVILKGGFVQKKGKDYLKMDTISIKIKLNGGKLNFSNLFGGDKTLGNVINDVINDNFNLIVTEILPPLEGELESVFLQITNKILSLYTFEQLFPVS